MIAKRAFPSNTMNSLRKSSKSLKRFINTKARDHGIKVPTRSQKTTTPDAATLSAAAKAPVVDTKSPPKAAKEATTPKPKAKATAAASKTPPSSNTTDAKTNRRTVAAKAATIPKESKEQAVVTKKKTIVKKKAKQAPLTESASAATSQPAKPVNDAGSQHAATSPVKSPVKTSASDESSTKQQQVQKEADRNDTGTVQRKVVKQRAAALQHSVQSKVLPDNNAAHHDTASVQTKVRQRANALQQSSAVQHKVASTTILSEPNQATDDTESVQSKAPSIQERAKALQQLASPSSVQREIVSRNNDEITHNAANDKAELSSPVMKPKVHSSSSSTSVTASVQSNTSRGSPDAKPSAANLPTPPQRSYSTSVASLARSGSGLPPRATKLKPTFRPMDHDETSTIATTFTTPISYVEFSAENERKLHLPNDSCFDATTKLLMCDLQSSEAEIVLKSMEALRATETKVLVSVQSALPILIAMRRWLTDASIQASGLQILHDTTADHLEFCQTAVSYGALQVCLAALQNHSRHALVQKHACGALVQLVVADAHTFVLKLDGVQIVTQTAVPHAPKYVVFLLQYLSYWQDEFRAKLVRDGGLQALAEIVEGSSGNLHKAAKATMQRLL